MLLSLIIPMYNAELYISQCLDSILHQGLDPDIYEIIVVNDGSKDSSSRIVSDYISGHCNIRLYSQDNKGQSVARNFGMSKATGKYIQFMDADDYLIPNSLKSVVRYVERGVDESIDMITFGICEGGADGVISNNGSGECLFQGNGYDYIATHNYNNGPWYYWLHRDFVNLNNLKFEEGKLCEDGMFTLTALLNARSIAQIDSDVYYYVMRPNSTTSTTDPKRRNQIIEGFCYAVDYFEKMLKEHNGMNDSCRERVEERRDSYVFFLLVRLMKMGDYKSAKKALSNLNQLSVYPIKRFPGRDYPGMKYKVIKGIFNTSRLYLLFCKLYGLRTLK